MRFGPSALSLPYVHPDALWDAGGASTSHSGSSSSSTSHGSSSSGSALQLLLQLAPSLAAKGELQGRARLISHALQPSMMKQCVQLRCKPPSYSDTKNGLQSMAFACMGRGCAQHVQMGPPVLHPTLHPST